MESREEVDKELGDKGNVNQQSAEKWLEMKNKIEDELQRLMIAQCTVNQESSAGKFEELVCRVDDLKEVFLEAAVKNSRKELVIKRIQLGNTLREEIFNDDYASNQFLQRSLKQLDLAQQLFRIHKETKETQEKLESVKLANVRLYKENLEMMSKLKSRNEKKQKLSIDVVDDEDYKRLKKHIDIKRMSIEVCRFIIKNLIMGLYQDWTQDQELTDLLLQCGEPFSVYM